MVKTDALQRIESHEKLCRIMQKQTHDKILKLEQQINRVESILLVSVGTFCWYGKHDFYAHFTIRLAIFPK